MKEYETTSFLPLLYGAGFVRRHTYTIHLNSVCPTNVSTYNNRVKYQNFFSPSITRVAWDV